MSGGVDSSVAAALLVEQGYDVVGVTLRLTRWDAGEDRRSSSGGCCSADTAGDAREVARTLRIPHYVLDAKDEFRRAVIDPFIASYSSGRTPVPCLACNAELKFGSLLGRARAWDAAAVATGHYARVTRDDVTGCFLLWKGADARKDQSDFLWSLDQSQLAGARFPVGHLTKSEVRAHARRLGLATADKAESQDLCFISDGDYRGFLRAEGAAAFASGSIVDTSGAVLGRHEGVANYTVGQRKGLGVASARPLYVVDVDAKRNVVTVGDTRTLERTRLVAHDVNFIACDPPATSMRVEAKIRHRHDAVPAMVRALGAGGAEVVFEMPQRAVTPGQSVVFYRGDRVVGGGVIARGESRVDTREGE
jgi:tRNA-specific 2-thiouridylase